MLRVLRELFMFGFMCKAGFSFQILIKIWFSCSSNICSFYFTPQITKHHSSFLIYRITNSMRLVRKVYSVRHELDFRLIFDCQWGSS